MRLHHLEMTAFGPFADTVSVDFDELSSSGLFLLTGPTGAGKSSVLDGVCFALYGDVPGDRATAKRLRSDQAPDDRAPRVSLEVTLAGRRFRLDRSPAWQRPKKRGTGTTNQQASVAVSELVDDTWVTLSTRLDEAGHLVTSLVGMTLPQFCQVAMLPQGRFQAFLRARSDERHALLARVFSTGRFEEVERWLRERRKATRQAAEAQGRVVSDLLSRVSETAAETLPQDWPALKADLSDEDAHSLRSWSHERLTATAAASATAQELLVRTRAEESRAREAHEQAAVLADRQRARAAAVAELRRLDDLEPGHVRRQQQVAAARRASRVTPVLDLARDAARDADRALQTAVSRIVAVGVAPTAPDPAGLLADEERAVVERLAEVRATLPRESELGTQEHALAVAVTGVQEAVSELDALAEERDVLPGRLARAREALADAGQACSSLDGHREALARADDRRAACLRLAELTPELASARTTRDRARSAVADARESWLAVREARLEGMAAELATRLAVGDSCPVCGSADHPHPASAASTAPDAASEKAARRLVDDAEAALHLHEEELRGIETEAALARQRVGGDSSAEAAAVARDTAAVRLQEVERRAATYDACAQAVSDHEQRLVSLDAAVVAAESRRAALTSKRDAAQRSVDALRAELAAALDGSGTDNLGDLLARLERRREVLTDAGRAWERHEQASHEHRRNAVAARDASLAAGFATSDEAAAAALDEGQVTALEDEVAFHDQARSRAEERRDDPDLSRAAEAAPPDLAALHRDLKDAETALAAAERGHAVAHRRHERLAHLHRDLVAALDDWSPLRADHVLAADVAAMVDGSSPDNQLQMRLSAYVLAHRLSQVVAAANERLDSMSDQRYSLEHTGRRGAGETRGGLSLLVRDDWSGESRDPATLSGGETFVVSLALALGLADVIAHEAGGADLDTLFVDEGFGSLDADTLDHVMDTLDGLRDGGRVVGVVSHVSEMRDRIPTQLEVATGRTGSSLALRVG